MKKINEKEFQKLEWVKNGRKPNPLVRGILNLNIGEHLLIEIQEWKNKTGISSMLGQYSARFQKKFSTSFLADKSGWVVTRTK